MNLERAGVMEDGVVEQQQAAAANVDGMTEVLHHARAYHATGVATKHEGALRRYDHAARSIEGGGTSRNGGVAPNQIADCDDVRAVDGAAVEVQARDHDIR